jgi:hypothetical protein
MGSVMLMLVFVAGRALPTIVHPWERDRSLVDWIS